MAQEQKGDEIIPGYSSIDDFTKNGFKALVEATKASNALPAERDWDFYKVHDAFNKIMNSEGDRLLRVMNEILHTQQESANIRNRDLEEKMEMVIEANDDILERVAVGIDEMNGIKKSSQEAVEIQAVSAQLPVNGSWNQLNKATFSVSSSIDTVVQDNNSSLKSIRLLTAKNIVRPQMFFKDKIDNRNDHPWIPRITEKPNSIKPLAIFLEESEHGELYSHPYEFELDHFTPPAGHLQKVTPVVPKPLEQTPLNEISTPEQLNDMLEELRQHSEFAVDLEHHSYRTFMGITCLMQISTKDADYLIDTFTLRDKLCILNEVFTKPSIVKVFHGADSDVEWLQRDLSLYVVNMFDTHQAAKQLEYSGLSLAYLLNRFCNVVPNKHFQLADWRIRPLPDELKTYARMDTHYLLYIYHMLKNELLKKGNGSDNILKSVLQQSTQICRRTYKKPILRDDSHLDFYRKCKRMFDNRQMYALKELYQWRDSLARSEDESTGYVLPNHMLLQIAETIPREMQGIMACCNPIPPLVRANLLELHRIILRAREQSAVKPILKEDNRSRGSTLQFAKINVDSPLHCPHDLSKSAEFRDDLPTLLDDRLKNDLNGSKSVQSKITGTVIKLEKIKSMYSVFNASDDREDENESEVLSKSSNVTFLAPFERYKLVKPFIQAEEEKAAAEKAKNPSKKTEGVTNDDRIAALHAHFVKVANETPQKTPAKELPESSVPPSISSNETLVSMGGSKKRKRRLSEDANGLHPDYKIPHNELHTPIPVRRNNNKQSRKKQFNKNKKARQVDAYHEQMPRNFNQGQQPNYYNQAETPHASEFYDSRDNSVSKRERRRQEWIEKNNARKEQKKMRQPPINQIEGDIGTPIDYPSVDYQQFQGGSGGPNQKQGQKKGRQPPRAKEWLQIKRERQEQTNLKQPPFNQIEGVIGTPNDYPSVDYQQFQGGSGGPNQKQGQKKGRQPPRAKEWLQIKRERQEQTNLKQPPFNQIEGVIGTPIDYPSVDYQQFQGGSGGPNQKQGQKKGRQTPRAKEWLQIKRERKVQTNLQQPPVNQIEGVIGTPIDYPSIGYQQFQGGSGGPNQKQGQKKGRQTPRAKEWLQRKSERKVQTNLQQPPVNQIEGDVFTPFDYSSVDFQQFQGGSGGPSQKQVVKSQFKGKNKNKKFNKNSNNRSATFNRRNQ